MPAVAPPPGRLYFVGPTVDGALVGGGSLAACALLAALPHDGAVVLPLLLPWLCNWPHFAATSYRLYHSRANVRQYPMTAIVVPIVVLAGMAWAFANPVSVAPVFVKAMLLWSPYHFSGQTLGISLGYARRGGCTVSRVERLALAGFIFGSYLSGTAHIETGVGVRQYIGVTHAKLGLAPWMGTAVDVAVGGFAVALVLLLVRRWWRGERALPLIVLLPALTQCVWFVLGRGVETFQALVPAFHSLQYLFIAWVVQLKERMTQEELAPSPRYVVYETLRWWTVNVVLGLLLFVGFPYACTGFGYELAFAMAVTSAAVQIHHFFVDGVIWKLRNPRVKSPLLASAAECWGPAEALREAA